MRDTTHRGVGVRQRAARTAFRRYAETLGVGVRRVTSEDFDRAHTNGLKWAGHLATGPVGFHAESRQVLYVGRLEDSIQFLPHEVTHCVWPDPLVMRGPEYEGTSGMLAFELAWLRRLLPGKDQIARTGWVDYALSGFTSEWLAETEHVARSLVQQHNLPNPWA